MREWIGSRLWERLRRWLPTPQEPGLDAGRLPTPWRPAPDPRTRRIPDARITARPFVAEAVRGHLLERAGDTVEARESYVRAARRTASVPEQRYLALRAPRLRQLAPLADPAG